MVRSIEGEIIRLNAIFHFEYLIRRDLSFVDESSINAKSGKTVESATINVLDGKSRLNSARYASRTIKGEREREMLGQERGGRQKSILTRARE